MTINSSVWIQNDQVLSSYDVCHGLDFCRVDFYVLPN